MTLFHLGATPQAPTGGLAAPTAAGHPQPPAQSSERPTAPTLRMTGARAVPAAPVELPCAVGACRSPQADWHTGFCAAHHQRFLDRVYDATRHIGRGEL